MPIETRCEVVWLPNMVVRKSLTAVLSAEILVPPVPSVSFIEPDVSNTRLTSSCRPWATAWAFTFIEETPISWEKNIGTVAWSSIVAMTEVWSSVALVIVTVPVLV